MLNDRFAPDKSDKHWRFKGSNSGGKSTHKGWPAPHDCSLSDELSIPFTRSRQQRACHTGNLSQPTLILGDDIRLNVIEIRSPPLPHHSPEVPTRQDGLGRACRVAPDRKAELMAEIPA
jgi:hypothetical protein